MRYTSEYAAWYGAEPLVVDPPAGLPTFAGAVIERLDPARLVFVAAFQPCDAVCRGETLKLRFTLPGQGPIERTGMVEWTLPAEEDGGSPCRVAVRLQQTDAAQRELESLIAGFKHRALVVDDERAVRTLATHVLQPNFRVHEAASGAEALEMLATEPISIMLVDFHMPGMDGVELLQQARSRWPSRQHVPVVYSAYLDAEAGQALINRELAFRYVQKGGSIDKLTEAMAAAAAVFEQRVDEAIAAAELRATTHDLAKENAGLRQQIGEGSVPEVVGRSRALHRAMIRVQQVAIYPTAVLLHGETGTGKEVVARAIHRLSDRRGRPFVAFSCAGVPDTLLQSALFGHARGAFTGADRERQGVFEAANHGTLFLDEIGELPVDMQVSLLRVLQEGEVVRLGESQPREVDVRLISATNRDLRAEVAARRFREDLYYRAVVFEIELPPLRERAGDIPLLAAYFLEVVGRRLGKRPSEIAPSCMQALERYPWPGNVRQLQNEIERAVIQVREGGVIELEHLSADVRAARHTVARADSESLSLAGQVRQLERRVIGEALSRTGNVVARAAELLDMEPSTLRKKIKRLGV